MGWDFTREAYVSERSSSMLPSTVRTSLGPTLGAIWKTPQITGLATTYVQQIRERAGRFGTPEDTQSFVDYINTNNTEQRRTQTAIWREPDDAKRQDLEAELGSLQRDKLFYMKEREEENIAAGRMLSVDQLSDTFGDDFIKWERPLTPGEAALLYNQKKEEVILEGIIARGPTGFVAGAAKLGVSLIATATDPIEVASAFIPIVREAQVVRWTAKAGRIAARAGQGAIEGFAGGVMIEPFYYALSKEQQLNYELSDMLLNIGLGPLLGGSLGTAIGAMSRNVPTSIDRDAATIALNDFVNDRPINLSPLGRDLRSTTAVIRIEGVDFQVPRVGSFTIPIARVTGDVPEFKPQGMMVPPAVAAARSRPTVDIISTPSRNKARAVAAKEGGVVTREAENYVVRRETAGDVARRPDGEPLTFKTKSAADKFIANVRKADTDDVSFDKNTYKDATPVEVPNPGGRPKFAIGTGMTKADLASLRRGGHTIKIPPGINTREAAVIADPEAAIDRAIKGTAGQKELARMLAGDRLKKPLPATPEKAADQGAATSRAEDTGDVEVEKYKAMVDALDETDLSKAQKAELDELNKTIERELARMNVIKKGAACMAANAV